MRNLKIVFLILSLSSLTLSCVTQSKCFEKFPPSRDTTIIQSVHEVPVYVPGDTVNLIVPIKCPDQDVAIMENSKLKQVIKILNGKLSSVTEIKPDTIRIKTVDTITQIKEVSKPIKYTPKFYIYCTWLLIGLFVAVLLYIAWKVFKPKIF